MEEAPLRWLLLKGFLIGMITGWLTLAFLFYPPVSGWGEAFKWDKLANWLSALGSAGAAIGAVWIATSDVRRRRRDEAALRRRKAVLLGAELINPVVVLRGQIMLVRGSLAAARRTESKEAALAAVRGLRLDAVSKFPRSSELDGLPEDFAAAIIATCSNVEAVNDVLHYLTKDPRNDLSMEQLRSVLDMDGILGSADRRLDELVDIASKHVPKIAMVKSMKRPSP